LDPFLIQNRCFLSLFSFFEPKKSFFFPFQPGDQKVSSYGTETENLAKPSLEKFDLRLDELWVDLTALTVETNEITRFFLNPTKKIQKKSKKPLKWDKKWFF